MADAINAREPRKLGLLTIPGVAVSLLPSLACPLCWPAYAALVSSLGLGFLASSTYLLPLTGVLLALALVALGLQAKNKGYGPLALGLVSAGTILPSKFLLASSAMTYAGAGLLMIASAWSLLPARLAVSASCATCATPGEGQSV
jgi:mercuric ion transport protein